MRELDDLLLAYLEFRFAAADITEKRAFQALLALPDPDLVAYLLQQQRADSEQIANVIDRILNRDLP